MTWAGNGRENNAIDEVCQLRVMHRPEFQAIACQTISSQTLNKVLR